MQRFLIVLAAIMTLAGCTSNAAHLLPPGYKGEPAIVFETATVISKSIYGNASEANYFVVSSINGETVTNSLTSGKSYQLPGDGGFVPSMEQYQIPANRSVTLRLTGERYSGHFGIVNSLYKAWLKPLRVSRKLTFTPRPGEHYRVKGILRPGASAVWLEDSSGRRIDG